MGAVLISASAAVAAGAESFSGPATHRGFASSRICRRASAGGAPAPRRLAART